MILYFFIRAEVLFIVRKAGINISHRSWNTPSSHQIVGMIQDSELTDVNSGEKLKNGC